MFQKLSLCKTPFSFYTLRIVFSHINTMIEYGLFGRWEKHERITEKLILWMEQKWGRLKRTAFRVNGKNVCQTLSSLFLLKCDLQYTEIIFGCYVVMDLSIKIFLQTNQEWTSISLAELQYIGICKSATTNLVFYLWLVA